MCRDLPFGPTEHHYSLEPDLSFLKESSSNSRPSTTGRAKSQDRKKASAPGQTFGKSRSKSSDGRRKVTAPATVLDPDEAWRMLQEIRRMENDTHRYR